MKVLFLTVTGDGSNWPLTGNLPNLITIHCLVSGVHTRNYIIKMICFLSLNTNKGGKCVVL